MHTAFLAPIPLLLFAATAAAQLQLGDIGVTGFSVNAFGVLSNGAPTGYVTTGFQGTGSATSQAILWDPANLQSFLVGGFGFVGRAAITGPGSATYTLITNGIGTASQMSFDALGQVVIADAGTDQIRVLDLGTANITDLSVGAQPWGTSLNAGTYDPFTGDVIAGGNGGIHRLVNGTTVGVPIVANLGGFLSGIVVDPLTTDIIATVLTSNRLIRVDAAGIVTDLITPGSISTPNAVDFDENGDFVVGGTAGQVFRVPYAGGAPTPIGAISTPATNVSGVAVVKSGGFARPYGTGCAGAFGNVALGALGSMVPGATVQLVSNNHAATSLGVQVLGFSDAVHLGIPLPFLLDPLLGTSGCSLYASIDATLVGVTGPIGAADLAFSLALPSIPTGFRLFAQHACFEPVPGSLSFSNGLVLQLP
jgi:hypothetical protein